MTHINTKIIGITGGIATGKSIVTSFIKSRGYKVIDADKISKDLMKKGKESYKKTVSYFGEKILKEDGEIDRRALGEMVFSKPQLLKALNDITHPLIFKEIKSQMLSSKTGIMFLDIPLLFEEYQNILKSNIYFDEIWLIYADKDIQIDRLMKRNDLTRDQALNRIDAQLAMEEKRRRASRTIYNEKSIKDLEDEVSFLLKNLY